MSRIVFRTSMAGSHFVFEGTGVDPETILRAYDKGEPLSALYAKNPQIPSNALDVAIEWRRKGRPKSKRVALSENGYVIEGSLQSPVELLIALNENGDVEGDREDVAAVRAWEQSYADIELSYRDVLEIAHCAAEIWGLLDKDDQDGNPYIMNIVRDHLRSARGYCALVWIIDRSALKLVPVIKQPVEQTIGQEQEALLQMAREWLSQWSAMRYKEPDIIDEMDWVLLDLENEALEERAAAKNSEYEKPHVPDEMPSDAPEVVDISVEDDEAVHQETNDLPKESAPPKEENQVPNREDPAPDDEQAFRP